MVAEIMENQWSFLLEGTQCLVQVSGFKIWSILLAVSAQTFFMDMNENLGCCYLMGSN